MSGTVIIVGLSVLFHSIAAILAFRLIKITGHKIAWIFIVIAVIIQVLRRLISFWTILRADENLPILPDEIIAILISFFTLLGMACITPLFLSIRRSEEAAKLAMSRTEEEHRKSEAIIAAIGDGISIQDINLTIKYQNDIHISLFGNHLGEKCYQAYRCVEGPCEPCPILLSFQTGQINSTEIKKPVAGGTSYFEITASPLRDAAGDIIAGIEVVHNVDHRKSLEKELEKNIHDLQEALANIETLNGLIPICSSCKRIRDDKGYWNQVESYVSQHSKAKFSHAMCPDCSRRFYPDLGLDFGPMLKND